MREDSIQAETTSSEMKNESIRKIRRIDIARYSDMFDTYYSSWLAKLYKYLPDTCYNWL